MLMGAKVRAGKIRTGKVRAGKGLMAAGLLVAGLGGCALDDGRGRAFPVFFEAWSASLDEGARAAVSGAASYAVAHSDLPVVVTGHASPDGGQQANVDISRTRAQVVTDALVADGVPAGRISRQADGQTDFVQTPQESRRVTIRVGAP